MNTYKENLQKISAIRQKRKTLEQEANALFNRVAKEENRLKTIKRQPDQEQTDQLAESIRKLKEKAANRRHELERTRKKEKEDLDSLYKETDPRELVEELTDSIPFLLLPVRIETRFKSVDNGKELWVRFFPDDVAVHTHEESLTDDEIVSGEIYWNEMWKAGTDTRLQKGAWRALTGGYGAKRAAWVAKLTVPLNWPEKPEELNEVAELEFPEHEDIKEYSWTTAPGSKIMPDRFCVMTYSAGEKIHEVFGENIPDPLIVGPDPLQIESQFKRENGDLAVDKDMQWMVDFETAVSVGMGVKIPLAKPYDEEGFDRVVVLGLRLSTDENENQRLVEELIDNHHYSVEGFGIVPQGTPTNNTEGAESGYSSSDPGSEASYAVETEEPLFIEETDPFEKSDGQRLAEALGIGFDPLYHIENSGSFDVKEALAMNKVLWPGTLGYFMDEMMHPVFSSDIITKTRDFFTRYVTGRGPIPAIRVGMQPYGILLTSVFSRWKEENIRQDDEALFLTDLQSVLKKIEDQWNEIVPEVSYAGKEGDAYQILLDILGLHASSVDYYQRFAVGSEYLWNYMVLQRQYTQAALWNTKMKQAAEQLLKDLGYDFQETPALFDLSFLQSHTALTGDLIDENPLSENDLVKVYNEATGENYLHWLSGSTSDTIKNETFTDSEGNSTKAPTALLYLMLRHSLLLEYWDSAMQIYTGRNVVDNAARRELELVNITEQRDLTKWDFLEADVSKIIPELSASSITMGSFLNSDAGLVLAETATLQDIRASLSVLAEMPTARLERVFAEHIDLCSYRLDAWQAGLFSQRLNELRFPETSSDAPKDRATGIYLGAFGWLENLRPADEKTVMDPASVPDDLREPENGAVFTDSENGGYIHGPSLNHAVTAAILRNAYLTHADADDVDTMSINLSSERVRTALSYIEGIRNGQELGALLGYQLERGLHDNYPELHLDEYIYDLRKMYPLVADKITESSEDASIQSMEARNVVDGYALLEASKLEEGETGSKYPYGVSSLPASGTSEANAIEKEVDALANAMDALSDLALSESVYQVAQGNYERAGGILKAFSEGSNPPDPEIVKTPRSGTAITQKVVIHFEHNLDMTDPENNSWNTTLSQKAITEPGVNKWLAGILGDPADIRCQLTYTDPETETEINDVVALIQLDLQPIDFVYMTADSLTDEMTEIEKRIQYYYRQANALSDEVPLYIQFIERSSDWDSSVKTFFEILPLAKSLRELITTSRHVNAAELISPNEDTEESKPQGYDAGELKSRADEAYSALQTVRDNLQTRKDSISDSYTDAELHALRDTMFNAAGFGAPQALPYTAVDVSDESKDALLTQAESILTMIDNNLSEAESLKEFEASLSTEEQSELTDEKRVTKYLESLTYIFGKSFKALPLYTATNGGEINTAISKKDNLLRASNPFIIDEWVQGLSGVRHKIGIFEEVRTFSETFHDLEIELLPIQLPYRVDDHWVAVEYPEEMNVDEDFLSIIHHAPSAYDGEQAQCGIVVDDWTEVIPNKQETTGIAVHYNQPNTEPPQTLLLVVAPEITGQWNWDDLTDSLNETLDRAKRRAVEPDHIDETSYAQLLPAMMTAVTRYLVTISTDLGVNVGLNKDLDLSILNR